MIGCLIHSIVLLLLREKREHYPRFITVLGGALSVALSLLTYYYTGQAFQAGGLGQGGGLGHGGISPPFNYFHYILWNDVALYLPLAALSGSLQSVQQAQRDGVYEVLLTMPVSRWRGILILHAPYLLQEVAMAAVVLLFASLIFDFRVSLSALAALAVLQCVALPLFHALSLVVAGLYLAYNRGASAIDLITSLAVLAGGAYFPPELLPALVVRASSALSPVHKYLDLARSAQIGGLSAVLTSESALFFFAGLCALPLGLAALHFGLHKVRARGSLVFY